MIHTIRTRLAALVCTALVSTACIVGAVGPATANGGGGPVASGPIA